MLGLECEIDATEQKNIDLPHHTRIYRTISQSVA